MILNNFLSDKEHIYEDAIVNFDESYPKFRNREFDNKYLGQHLFRR